jgi:hypothetical protein
MFVLILLSRHDGFHVSTHNVKKEIAIELALNALTVAPSGSMTATIYEDVRMIWQLSNKGF